MRWTEIEARAAAAGIDPPSYRQMDVWTRTGKLQAETRGDSHGRYRWWPPAEVDAAFLVARLVSAGVEVDLAFQIARTRPDAAGERVLLLDGARHPHIQVSVAGD